MGLKPMFSGSVFYGSGGTETRGIQMVRRAPPLMPQHVRGILEAKRS
jgi:hypothetical protein